MTTDDAGDPGASPSLIRISETTVASSPTYGRLVFVLAPPGSGAEMMLAGLSEIDGVLARPAPSMLFSSGLGRLVNNVNISVHVRRDGLAALAEPQLVLAAIRELGDALFAPGSADVLVDHSPPDARWAEAIESLYPDAQLVHLVRDGRVSVALDPGPVDAAAATWAEAHRAIMRVPPSAGVVRVFCEDLVADPAAAMTPLLERIGGVEQVGRVGRAVGLASAAQHERRTRAARRAVETTASDLLEAFGYLDRIGASRRGRSRTGRVQT